MLVASEPEIWEEAITVPDRLLDQTALPFGADST